MRRRARWGEPGQRRRGFPGNHMEPSFVDSLGIRNAPASTMGRAPGQRRRGFPGNHMEPSFVDSLGIRNAPANTMGRAQGSEGADSLGITWTPSFVDSLGIRNAPASTMGRAQGSEGADSLGITWSRPSSIPWESGMRRRARWGERRAAKARIPWESHGAVLRRFPGNPECAGEHDGASARAAKARIPWESHGAVLRRFPGNPECAGEHDGASARATGARIPRESRRPGWQCARLGRVFREWPLHARHRRDRRPACPIPSARRPRGPRQGRGPPPRPRQTRPSPTRPPRREQGCCGLRSFEDLRVIRSSRSRGGGRRPASRRGSLSGFSHSL